VYRDNKMVGRYYEEFPINIRHDMQTKLSV
jgi:hypothetical protein